MPHLNTFLLNKICLNQSSQETVIMHTMGVEMQFVVVDGAKVLSIISIIDVSDKGQFYQMCTFLIKLSKIHRLVKVSVKSYHALLFISSSTSLTQTQRSITYGL